jgi:hypothetical protein
LKWSVPYRPTAKKPTPPLMRATCDHWSNP